MLGPSDVGQVVTVDLAEGVPVSGTLAPIADARLTSPFDDQLELVRVQEGQRVAKGEVLARFRPSALGPAAASAAAQRHMAEADLQRMKNLEAAGAISKRELDDAEATLKVAEANAAQADKRLGDATVRAPFAGVVAERSVRTGDRVAVGDPLFRIVNTAALEFEARVTPEHASQLLPGAPVALRVSGLPSVINGHIARINTTADPATREVRVYVAVPNRDGRLVGDLFASGRVVLREAKAALAVPITAVRLLTDGRAEVWTVAAGKLVSHSVHTGVRDEIQNLVQIGDDLRAGDTVIVSAIEGLEPGQLVQIAGARK